MDAEALTDVDERALLDWLTDPAVPKAAHDLKGMLLALHARGWDIAGVTSDTALAAYLALPGQRTFDLADLVLRYLRRNLRADGEPDTGQLTLDGGAEEADAGIGRDQAVRARAIADLARALDDDLDQRGATRLLRELELPLTTVIAGMERTGIGADLDYLVGLQAEFAAQVKAVEQEAYASVGREFNLGSPKQLQQILFDELRLPKTKRIKSGYTTDADALVWLAEQAPDVPLLGALLRHRDVSRLKTVVDSLIPMVDDHGRIHTTFNQVIAATGRLSSQDPNLQNIPIRTAEGRRIRRAFVVGDGYESLMTADYSQIEMRIMATLSEDAGLIEAFESGEDLHTFVASRAHNLPPAAVDPELRRRIKAMSYGLAYGLSAYGLAQQLRIHPDEAREQMDAYFQRFGGVRVYLRHIVEQARRDGYTETIMGRRRYLPDLTSDNRQRREMAERMALNAPIQGSAADIIKVAMLGVDRALRRAAAAVPAAAAGARRAGAGDRAGRARAGRGAAPPGDGRCVRAGRAAGRVGRRRPHLGRRRPLRGARGWVGVLRRRSARHSSRGRPRTRRAVRAASARCARARSARLRSCRLPPHRRGGAGPPDWRRRPCRCCSPPAPPPRTRRRQRCDPPRPTSRSPAATRSPAPASSAARRTRSSCRRPGTAPCCSTRTATGRPGRPRRSSPRSTPSRPPHRPRRSPPAC